MKERKKKKSGSSSSSSSSSSSGKSIAAESPTPEYVHHLKILDLNEALITTNRATLVKGEAAKEREREREIEREKKNKKTKKQNLNFHLLTRRSGEPVFTFNSSNHPPPPSLGINSLYRQELADNHETYLKVPPIPVPLSDFHHCRNVYHCPNWSNHSPNGVHR